MRKKRKSQVSSKNEAKNGKFHDTKSIPSAFRDDQPVTYCCNEDGGMLRKDLMELKKAEKGLKHELTPPAPPSSSGSMTKKRLNKQTSAPSAPSFVSGTMTRNKISKCRGRQISRKRSKMGSGTFDNHMETIWSSFSEDKRAAFAYLDSLCYVIYEKNHTFALEMIKRKEIFSKKYVFVPIVCWDHWRLVIFCHFGDTVRSKTRTRCILLLDSVEMCADAIGPDVRKFVFDIFEAEGRPETKNVIYRIPLKVPKVPQQTNDVDCGRFVLYFIKLFMDNAPENFCLSKGGYPYFLKANWFEAEDFARFCDKLDEEIQQPVQVVGQVQRCSKRIRNTRVSAQQTVRHTRRCIPQVEEEIVVLDDSETSSV